MSFRLSGGFAGDFTTEAARYALHSFDRQVDGVWIEEAKRILASRGVNTAGWTDQQVAARAKAEYQSIINTVGNEVFTPVELNPLNWEIFGIQIKYWLLIVGGVLVIQSRR